MFKTSEAKREYQRKYHAAKRAENPQAYYKNLNESYRKRREKNEEGFREKGRRAGLKRRYNMTLEQWDTLFASQFSSCANKACRTTDPETPWHTDHCHETRRIRGILCPRCNKAMGMLGDDPELLRGLANYLDTHRWVIENTASSIGFGPATVHALASRKRSKLPS